MLGGAQSARWKYQSTGVARNSLTAVAASSGSATGNMKPVRSSAAIAFGPTGSRVVIGVSAQPPYFRARERLTVTARAAACGQAQRSEHGGERVARDARDREQPRDPLGVRDRRARTWC